MMNRFCFVALDKTLRNVMGSENKDNKTKPFGGKVFVLVGDFRQVLPVIRVATRQQIVSSAVNASKVWRRCEVLRLTMNMGLSTANNNADQEEVK